MFSKINKRVLLVTFSIVIIMTFLINSMQVYKFEVEQDEYPAFFPKLQHEEWNYEDMQFHNNYYGNISYLNSIYFPKNNSLAWINIEHLVPLVQNDVKKLPEIKSTDGLFSLVEFHSNLQIQSVELRHFYKGKKLDKNLSYIYNKNITKRTSKYKIINKDNLLNLPNKKQFAYANIYRFPISKFKRALLPKAFLFNDDMVEIIKIKYKQKDKIYEKTFKFKLKWKGRIYWQT